MEKGENVLLSEAEFDSFDYGGFNKNSGFVEADYRSGVIVLKPTDKEDRNIDLKTILKLI